MFNQLVESNNHRAENKRRGGFLLSAFLVVGTIFFSGILWSLFAKDLGMNAGNLELSELVAPLAVVEEQPKTPDNAPPQKSKQSAPNADRRTEIIQNITESPRVAPEKISIQKSIVPPRNPNNLTIVADRNANAENAASYKENSDPNITGLENGGSPDGIDGGDSASVSKIPPPPPPFVKKEEIKPPSNTRVSLGVINGKAINLVTPPYPPAAKAVRAAGEVSVQVAIDEKGNVTAANAVSGHPLLRQAAENAARHSKFNPTLLSEEPVKVSGLIVYKFAAQ